VEPPAEPAEEPAAEAAEEPMAAPAEDPAAEPVDTDPFSQNGSPGIRLWTDSSGKYHVLARFVSVIDGGTVRLQKANGKYVRVAIDRLSAFDQQFVQRQLEMVAAAW
jgi:hypothetical protein